MCYWKKLVLHLAINVRHKLWCPYFDCFWGLKSKAGIGGFPYTHHLCGTLTVANSLPEWIGQKQSELFVYQQSGPNSESDESPQTQEVLEDYQPFPN